MVAPRTEGRRKESGLWTITIDIKCWNACMMSFTLPLNDSTQIISVSALMINLLEKGIWLVYFWNYGNVVLWLANQNNVAFCVFGGEDSFPEAHRANKNKDNVRTYHSHLNSQTLCRSQVFPFIKSCNIRSNWSK